LEGEECQKRWRNALDPKISGTVSWSSEEVGNRSRHTNDD
jgi:hypothetical protein